jgi:hypothetical protein
MASILKVDTIQDQSGNNIINENADTITIGASGDTVTTSANVGIGIASPNGILELKSSGNTNFFITAGNTSASQVVLGDPDDIDVGKIAYSHNVNAMEFVVNTAERMKIGSNGQLTITTNAAGDNGMIFINANADPFGLQMDFSTASPDNNSRTFQLCEDSTTTRMIVYSDGDLANHDGVYGSISDERIKQDIRDSNSQWNDIKNIRVRNFKKKDDVRQYGDNAWEQIGVIAQELETVSPKLIKHSDPTQSDILSDSSFGTLYQEEDEIPEGKKVGDIKEVHDQIKKVSYSVLYMKSIKALQEAMERIETLEAKVTTLENK